MTSAATAPSNNSKKAKKATAEPKVEAPAVVSAPPAPQAEKISASAKKKNKKNKAKAAAAAALATTGNGAVGDVAVEQVALKQDAPVSAKKEKNLTNALEKSKDASTAAALPDKVVVEFMLQLLHLSWTLYSLA